MLKINELSKKLVLKAFKVDNNKIVKDGDYRAKKIVVNLFNRSKNNMSRNLIYILNI